MFLLLIASAPIEHAEHPHEEEECCHQQSTQAKVDKEDVYDLELSCSIHHVHHEGEGEEEEHGFAARDVPVESHHVKDVPEAEATAEGGVEAEDEIEAHVGSANAVTEEEAVMVEDIDAAPAVRTVVGTGGDVHITAHTFLPSIVVVLHLLYRCCDGEGVIV